MRRGVGNNGRGGEFKMDVGERNKCCWRKDLRGWREERKEASRRIAIYVFSTTTVDANGIAIMKKIL